MLSIRHSTRRAATAGLALLLAVGGAALVRPADNAAAASLSNVAWSVSNTATGQTGVTYAWNFKTASSGTINTIVLTLPPGTSGTPAVSQVIGIGAGTISAISSNQVTYTVTSPVSVAASYPIYIELSGFTNRNGSGTFTSTVTTQTSAPATIDSGTSNSQSFSSTGVTTTVAVAKSTVFSIDTNSFSLLLDPAVNASATQAINIGISSNAKNGYTLTCQVDTQPTSGSVSLGAYTANMAAATAWLSGGADKFGYALSVTNNGGAGSPAAGGALSATNYAGFTVGGENCAAASGKTGNPLGATSTLTGCAGQSGLCDKAAHWWLMNVKASVDYNTEALTYTDTITLTVTPSY